MKNVLITGDLHINLESLEECKLILEEQKELIKKYNVDTYINLGDTFDFIKPNSVELDLFASFLKEINIPSIIIAAKTHESETPENSILNHFGILSNNIKIVKEYKDSNKLYCGHFIVKESKLNKFGATISKTQLKNYRFVVLGHGHHYETIPPNICQLGSSRWINFDEAQDKHKLVLLIEDYGTDNPKCNFLSLKSPYSMKDIMLNKNEKNSEKKEVSEDSLSTDKGKESVILREKRPLEELMATLDKINPKTKIRILFKDYSLWVNFLPYYNKYKEKFVLFKDKKEFLITNKIEIGNKKESTNLKESLISWFEKNKTDEQIKQILLEELK